jgi:hypothetical protein
MTLAVGHWFPCRKTPSIVFPVSNGIYQKPKNALQKLPKVTNPHATVFSNPLAIFFLQSTLDIYFLLVENFFLTILLILYVLTFFLI